MFRGAARGGGKKYHQFTTGSLNIEWFTDLFRFSDPILVENPPTQEQEPCFCTIYRCSLLITAPRHRKSQKSELGPKIPLGGCDKIPQVCFCDFRGLQKITPLAEPPTTVDDGRLSAWPTAPRPIRPISIENPPGR